MTEHDPLAAAFARVAREKGWPAEERARMEDWMADEENRRAVFNHPRYFEFATRAVSEMLDERRTGGRVVTTDGFETAARAVALMVAEGLVEPG